MTVVGDQKLLDKYDLKNNSAILAEEKHMPLYEEIMMNDKIEYTAGGSAQNSLRIAQVVSLMILKNYIIFIQKFRLFYLNTNIYAQWVLRKPSVAVFFGAVGRDEYSKILQIKANDEGLDVKYQYTQEKPTGKKKFYFNKLMKLKSINTLLGTCAVIVTNNGKDRSLCANLSAATTFTEDHLDVPENKAIIENAKIFLVSVSFYDEKSIFLLKINVTSWTPEFLF